MCQSPLFPWNLREIKVSFFSRKFSLIIAALFQQERSGDLENEILDEEHDESGVGAGDVLYVQLDQDLEVGVLLEDHQDYWYSHGMGTPQIVKQSRNSKVANLPHF